MVDAVVSSSGCWAADAGIGYSIYRFGSRSVGLGRMDIWVVGLVIRFRSNPRSTNFVFFTRICSRKFDVFLSLRNDIYLHSLWSLCIDLSFSPSLRLLSSCFHGVRKTCKTNSDVTFLFIS